MRKQGIYASLLAGCVLMSTACQKNVASTSTVDSTGTADSTNTVESSDKADSTNIVNSTDTESDTTTTDSQQSEKEVTLLMVGDVLLHDRVEDACKREDGSYEYDVLFEDMKDAIEAADLAFVNQEVIIGGKELGISGYPAFNTDYSLGDALVEAGFDVVLHATNHALDKGEKGIRNCLDFWQGNYPNEAVLGIHSSAEDQNTIYVQECNGIKIAILNYTYGTNGISLPADMPYGVDYLDESRVKADLQKAEELADFTIVCPHWGTEYELEEGANQRKWAKLMAENGADLIMGTHPHVIEPMAWVSGNDITKLDLVQEGYDGGLVGGADFEQDALAHKGETLVYYSLGNFLNWTSGEHAGVADRMVGGMSHVTIARDEAGEAYIKEYGIQPVVAHLEKGQDGVRVYPLEQYTQEMADKNEIIHQDPAFSRDYCLKLCEKVW